MTGIRQISDKVLHTPPKKVDFENLEWDLQAIYQIMLQELITKSGVGIAANQCAEIANPPQMVIVGIPKEKPELLASVQQRYPNQDVPTAILMINPQITHRSGETYFPQTGEGCLSVRGGFRGKVSRDKAVTVNYFDIDGNEHTETFKEFAAHIVQHECDHLNGNVSLQKILNELGIEELQQLKETLESKSKQSNETSLKPQLIFDRDKDGKVVFDFTTITQSLDLIDEETIDGVLKEIVSIVENRARNTVSCTF